MTLSRSSGWIPYAELHSHSYFSFLDGTASPEDLVWTAAKLGIGSLALTDHNGLYGIPRFLSAARKAGITPLVGAEVTLGQGTKRALTPDPTGDHLVVLTRSPEGYRALSKIISHGHMAQEEKGIFSLEITELAAAKPASGWMILTGCRKGPLQRSLKSGGPLAAEKKLLWLMELFGRDDLVVEVSYHWDPVDNFITDTLVKLAYSYNLVAVATQNVHAVGPEGRFLGFVTGAVRANKTLENMDGYFPAAGIPVMQPPQVIKRLFHRYPGLLEATLEVARLCAYQVELIAPGLPKDLAPSGLDDVSMLRRLTLERAPQRYGTRDKERVVGAYRQLEYELNIIADLGFAGYFLVVTDIVDFCKRENIYCQGRGSAANSAVCYALGITNADPVSLGLLFERFLSPERDGPPDIDVDIESGRRDEVIQYVYRRYGRDRAAQVASVITYGARSALRDVARVYGVLPERVDAWSNRLEHRRSLIDSLALKDRNGKSILDIPEGIARTVESLIGIPRHLGLHVGGMVICDRPITEVCPTEWARKEGRSVLQWDKDDCASMGLVKFDLLGLGMLQAIHEMVDIAREAYGDDIDIALIPQEPEVYQMLERADSVGVFQVESRAQMATLPRLKPSCFYDLVVEVALIRPGPIQGKSVHPYLRRRSGEEQVTYLHPLLERSLAKTLGVPLFQEQLMQMAMDVAGFTPAEADELRQAMSSRRSRERMLILKERLFAGMEKNGIQDDTKELIFEKLSAFANFGFPESHAASFAYLVYVSAWFKLRYPAVFYAGLMRSQPMGFWSIQTLISDAKRHGVEVTGPSLDLSKGATYVGPDKDSPSVVIGLEHVKGIGKEKAKAIYQNGPYRDLIDLCTKVSLTQSQIANLAKSGALDRFDPVRKRLVWRSKEGQEAFASLGEVVMSGEVPTLDPENKQELFQLQLDSMGAVTIGHPMELIRESLQELGVATISEVLELPDKAMAKVAGSVTHRQRPGTARGVVFLNLEDETGLCNVLIRPSVWGRYRSEARANSVVVEGRVQRTGTVVTLIAERIAPISEAMVMRSRDFR